MYLWLQHLVLVYHVHGIVHEAETQAFSVHGFVAMVLQFKYVCLRGYRYRMGKGKTQAQADSDSRILNFSQPVLLQY